MEAVKDKIVAKFYKRINKTLGDFNINLCSTTDIASIPAQLQKKERKCYVTITGTNLPCLESVDVEYVGKWIKHEKFGYQFKADCYSIIPPSSEKGIVNFLSGKNFKGIGKVQAQRIVDTFGSKTIQIIENNPVKLITVKGITEDKIEIITSSYNRLRGYSRLAVFLSSFGISSDTALKIYDEIGDDAEELIKINPYRLMEVRGVSFNHCDKIAVGLNSSLDSEERIEAGIKTVLNQDSEINGNMFTDREQLKKVALNLLNSGFATTLVSSERYDIVFDRMQSADKIHVVAKELVFSQKNELMEQTAARKMVTMLKMGDTMPESLVDRYLMNFMMGSTVRLSDKQQGAIKTAMMNKVTVITGGAGTGKTTIIKGIIACYKGIYPKGAVTLMAPTGKAARRLEDATGVAASTIHSKLEIYEGSSVSGGNTLPKGLIVVDEVSMLDSFLFAKILNAITDLESTLVLVGDDNQLPSVGAGAVLTQLIKSGVVPVYKLTEIFRQAEGGVIVDNALKVINGDTGFVYNNEFRLIEVANENVAEANIVNEYKKAVARYGIKNVALLCPLRRKNSQYRCVSDVLNESIQNAVNPRDESKGYCVIAGKEFRLNDRVMQFKNTDIASNGDTGEIIDITRLDNDLALVVQWDNGKKQTAVKEDIEDIGLAYAMSVHKSQGMEYDCVIMCLLSCQNSQMLKNKAILYTGLTRAKKSIVIVGNQKAIDNCILSKNVAVNRNTLLAQRLVANMPAKQKG